MKRTLQNNMYALNTCWNSTEGGIQLQEIFPIVFNLNIASSPSCTHATKRVQHIPRTCMPWWLRGSQLLRYHSQHEGSQRGSCPGHGLAQTFLYKQISWPHRKPTRGLAVANSWKYVGITFKIVFGQVFEQDVVHVLVPCHLCEDRSLAPVS